MTMTGNMTKVYKENRGVRKGRDLGSYMVYHIFCPGKHRGILQGYIGVSTLNIEGVRKRYEYELIEGLDDRYARKTRHVHTQMAKYGWDVKEVMTGLTKEQAYDLEERLRPKANPGGRDRYNWNIAKGG